MAGTRASLHEALVRNGYRVPTLKCRLSTYDFLRDVRHGVVYVPRIKEMTRGQCASKPTTEAIQDELIKVLEMGTS